MTDELIRSLQGRLAAAEERVKRHRVALRFTLDAIKSGRSEPLFAARDVIEIELADSPEHDPEFATNFMKVFGSGS